MGPDREIISCITVGHAFAMRLVMHEIISLSGPMAVAAPLFIDLCGNPPSSLQGRGIVL